jgi:hypothetical protein
VQPSFRNNDGVDAPLDSTAEAGAIAGSSTASSCHRFCWSPFIDNGTAPFFGHGTSHLALFFGH